MRGRPPSTDTPDPSELVLFADGPGVSPSPTDRHDRPMDPSPKYEQRKLSRWFWVLGLATAVFAATACTAAIIRSRVKLASYLLLAVQVWVISVCVVKLRNAR